MPWNALSFERRTFAERYGPSQNQMRITVEIPDRKLKDAFRFTNAKTDNEAVVRAVTEFNRVSRMAELSRHAGTCVDLISPEELGIERRKG
jgi:hypothetical protein